MSIYYSRYLLNSYSSTDYFKAHVPAEYPTNLTLQACRAFRHLPPNLRQLCILAKQWATANNQPTNGIEQWYDEQGYELNPNTDTRLTDEEIDAQWGNYKPNITVTDIPIPTGGFANPATWQPATPLEEEPDDPEAPDKVSLLRDIKLWGREYVAEYYDVPMRGVKSDRDLARKILVVRASRRAANRARHAAP